MIENPCHYVKCAGEGKIVLQGYNTAPVQEPACLCPCRQCLLTLTFTFITENACYWSNALQVAWPWIVWFLLIVMHSL